MISILKIMGFFLCWTLNLPGYLTFILFQHIILDTIKSTMCFKT